MAQRGDRLDIQFSNVQHQDVVEENVTIQDFLFFKIGRQPLTLRLNQIDGESVLILGDDDPDHMGKECRTKTEFLYKRTTSPLS